MVAWPDTARADPNYDQLFLGPPIALGSLIAACVVAFGLYRGLADPRSRRRLGIALRVLAIGSSLAWGLVARAFIHAHDTAETSADARDQSMREHTIAWDPSYHDFDASLTANTACVLTDAEGHAIDHVRVRGASIRRPDGGLYVFFRPGDRIAYSLDPDGTCLGQTLFSSEPWGMAQLGEDLLVRTDDDVRRWTPLLRDATLVPGWGSRELLASADGRVYYARPLGSRVLVRHEAGAPDVPVMIPESTRYIGMTDDGLIALGGESTVTLRDPATLAPWQPSWPASFGLAFTSSQRGTLIGAALLALAALAVLARGRRDGATFASGLWLCSAALALIATL